MSCQLRAAAVDAAVCTLDLMVAGLRDQLGDDANEPSASTAGTQLTYLLFVDIDMPVVMASVRGASIVLGLGIYKETRCKSLTCQWLHVTATAGKQSPLMPP